MHMAVSGAVVATTPGYDHPPHPPPGCLPAEAAKQAAVGVRVGGDGVLVRSGRGDGRACVRSCRFAHLEGGPWLCRVHVAAKAMDANVGVFSFQDGVAADVARHGVCQWQSPVDALLGASRTIHVCGALMLKQKLAAMHVIIGRVLCSMITVLRERTYSIVQHSTCQAREIRLEGWYADLSSDDHISFNKPNISKYDIGNSSCRSIGTADASGRYSEFSGTCLLRLQASIPQCRAWLHSGLDFIRQKIAGIFGSYFYGRTRTAVAQYPVHTRLCWRLLQNHRVAKRCIEYWCLHHISSAI